MSDVSPIPPRPDRNPGLFEREALLAVIKLAGLYLTDGVGHHATRYMLLKRLTEMAHEPNGVAKIVSTIAKTDLQEYGIE